MIKYLFRNKVDPVYTISVFTSYVLFILNVKSCTECIRAILNYEGMK